MFIVTKVTEKRYAYMANIKRAIGYVRVSTEEQSGDGKFGVEVQSEGIREYCQTHDIVLEKLVVEKGSGAKERPLMNQLVFSEDTTNPPYDAVIVYKNDRIARDMQLYFYYEYVLEKKNVQLISVQDDFLNGVDGSVARLYKSMMQFVAEQERKNITLRTSSGRLAKAKQGGHAGGGVPYGYKLVKKEVVLVPEQAEVVRRMFYWYDRTESVAKTRKALLEEYPNFVGRNGQQVSYFTIRSLIANRLFYEGLYKYSNLGYVLGNYEPILEMSEKAKEILKTEQEKFNKERKLEESGEFYG